MPGLSAWAKLHHPRMLGSKLIAARLRIFSSPLTKQLLLSLNEAGFEKPATFQIYHNSYILRRIAIAILLGFIAYLKCDKKSTKFLFQYQRQQVNLIALTYQLFLNPVLKHRSDDCGSEFRNVHVNLYR